jgi:hypothetical protein
MIPSNGNGAAASIQARFLGNVSTAQPPPSARPRAAFEEAWRVFLANRTEADFHEWRHARDWHEKKYAMWAAGEKLPSQKPSSLMRCPCGEVFDSHLIEDTLVHVPHISAVHAADGIRR